jgi:hypothetical protein
LDDAALSSAELGEKRATYGRLQRLFVDTDMGPSSGAGAKIELMWHSVPSAAGADAIFKTGLSSRVSNQDEGYFGKGVYLTPEAEYAAFYANGQAPPKRGATYTLLLCAVCLAAPYPLTRGVDYERTSSPAISKFHYNYGAVGTAKALAGGSDAHFVAVSVREGWQAATKVVDADYHKLVVSDEQQVLPFAKVVVKIK